MINIPKIISYVVNNDLCTGCGLCVYKCKNKVIEISWNEYGFLIPKITGNCNSSGDCLKVCPFNPFPQDKIKTENELASLFLYNANFLNEKLGRYNNIYTGYSEEFRLTSSSGGIATYIFTELLESGIVDHIFSVRESITPGYYYEYTICNSRQDLISASETKYFPVTLSTVYKNILDLEGNVAIVGVACFIKAIRLSQYFDSTLRSKVIFLVGLICGGMKSRFFTEYLAFKVGVSILNIKKPKFRIKNLNSSADDYSFSCSDNSNKDKDIKIKSLGDMWGTGLFKANACDFCDDVSTELADISLGDAWITPYERDGRGTNVIITRSLLAESIIKKGSINGRIKIENLSLEKFIKSQQGNFNHRQLGISARIKQAKSENRLIPPKRFLNNNISFEFNIVQNFRMKLRKASLKLWVTNKGINFDKKIAFHQKKLYYATRFYQFMKKFSKSKH